MVTLKIKVTKEILERSKMCGIHNIKVSTNCAVALAVRDIFPRANVELEYIEPFTKLESERIELPMEATDYIILFDEFKKTPLIRLMMPEIEFEVIIPDTVIDQINIDEIKPLLQNHPTLKLSTV